jgi:hypothetical protein
VLVRHRLLCRRRRLVCCAALIASLVGKRSSRRVNTQGGCAYTGAEGQLVHHNAAPTCGFTPHTVSARNCQKLSPRPGHPPGPQGPVRPRTC